MNCFTKTSVWSALGLISGSLFALGCDDGGGDEHVHEHDASVDAPADAHSDADDNDGSSGTQNVAIQFAARVGDEAFDCGTPYEGLGTANSTVEFLDFRFYVHDVELVTEDGDAVAVDLDQDGAWQFENLALLDFEDDTGTCANGTTEVNTTVRGTAPSGVYTGVRFKLGVPFALNHQDAALAPSPLNLSTLFWSWNGGYKFARIDTRADLAGDAVNVVNFHLGSTGCNGDGPTDVPTECTNANRAEIELDDFDVDDSTVVFDYAAMVEGSDLSADGGGAPGCMSGASDPECGPMFSRLGVDLATGNPAEGQSTFSVE
jgi:uncharacterized repeat protein (TIGR04052 family)